MDPVPDSNLHSTREVLARMFEDLYAQSTRDLLQAASRDEMAQVVGILGDFSEHTTQILKCLRGSPPARAVHGLTVGQPLGLDGDFRRELLDRLDGWMQQIFEVRAEATALRQARRVPAEPPDEELLDATLPVLHVEVPS